MSQLLYRSLASLALIGVTFLSTAAITACIAVPLPYPHKAVPHSSISGKVVDRDTGQPISQAKLTLRYGEGEAQTGEDGTFEFVAAEERRYFFWLSPFALLFFPMFHDIWKDCDDDLEIKFVRGNEGQRYRNQEIAVVSCPIPPITFAYSRRENLSIHDDVGTIELLRLPEEAPAE